ncbi:Ig-like domain-containing protein, partial [Emticicia sp. 17c]|uniref:Ig-like domain-containing protein n=1 Tax=Emticicia sp. 17c TaxID=3127704 RepID=UPI00301CD6AC
SNNVTGTSITVTPATAGTSTYKAICTVSLNGKSCVAEDSGVLTVIPEVKVTVNDVTACYGEAATLTATGCQGTVVWSNNVTGTSITVTPATAGTSTYKAVCTVSLNGKSCVAEDSGVLTVIPEVKVTVNDVTACYGEAATLTATGCQGTVVWSNNVTGTSITVTPATAGTSTYKAVCTVSLNGKSCVAEDSGVLTVIPEVKVTVNDVTACYGEAATLTATGCQGTVVWSNNVTGTSITVTPATAGTSTYKAVCTVSLNGKSCVAEDSGVLTVIPEVKVNVNDVTACYGEAATLTATGCQGTVVWSNNVTGTSITVTPATAGTSTYKAVCTVSLNGKSCVAEDSGVLTVIPGIEITVEDKEVCVGTQAILTASGCVGTITWSNGATGTSITITKEIAGTYSYSAICSVTVNNKVCTKTDEGILTVNPNLTPDISSNSPVCEGGAINLKAAGGVSYSWTGPNGYTSSEQNPVISPATINNNGTYTVTVTNAKGCTGTATTAVQVKVLPPITSINAEICEGEKLTLTAPDYGIGADYKWTGPASFSQTGRTVTINSVTLDNKGIYTITITKDLCSTSGTVTVNVKKKPTPPVVAIDGPNTICEKGSVKLVASGCTDGLISWSTNATGSSITVTNEGTYSAFCKIEGCTSNASNVITISKGTPPSAPKITSSDKVCCEGHTVT